MWLYKLIQNSKCAVWILTGTYSKCWTYFWGKMALFWVPQIGRSTGETRYFRRSRKDFGWEEFRLAICSIQTETWSIFSQILPKKWSQKKNICFSTLSDIRHSSTFEKVTKSGKFIGQSTAQTPQRAHKHLKIFGNVEQYGTPNRPIRAKSWKQLTAKGTVVNHSWAWIGSFHTFKLYVQK